MGTEESNKFGAYYNFLEPKDEALNKPLPPHWTTTLQAYYNSGSTPTSLLNPQAAGSYFAHYVWPNQVNNTTLHYDFLHDHMRLSNNSTVDGVILNQQQQQPSMVPLPTDAASIFSEKVRTMFGGNNLDSMKKCDRSLQPKSPKTKESRENENKCSAPRNDKDRVSVSGASESKESPDGIHDTENVFPPTKKQERNVMLENEQNKTLGTGINASSSTAQLAKLEEDELRKERKRQSNRESAKRSRMRKQKECEELHKNMDILKGENSALTQRLMRLSEECVELRNENDSIQEELVKLYGAESIADLLPMKPA